MDEPVREWQEVNIHCESPATIGSDLNMKSPVSSISRLFGRRHDVRQLFLAAWRHVMPRTQQVRPVEQYVCRDIELDTLQHEHPNPTSLQECPHQTLNVNVNANPAEYVTDPAAAGDHHITDTCLPASPGETIAQLCKGYNDVKQRLLVCQEVYQRLRLGYPDLQDMNVELLPDMPLLPMERALILSVHIQRLRQEKTDIKKMRQELEKQEKDNERLRKLLE